LRKSLRGVVTEASASSMPASEATWTSWPGSLPALEKGKRFLFRTAAAIIPALIGLAPRALLAAGISASPQKGCGLIIVALCPHVVAPACPSAEACRCYGVELDVRRLLSGDGRVEIERVTGEANRRLVRSMTR